MAEIFLYCMVCYSRADCMQTGGLLIVGVVDRDGVSTEGVSNR